MQKSSTNAVFFYGFPKDNVTSNQIRQKIIEQTGIDVKNNMPQIRRDINKPEWNAVVKFDTQEDYKKVLEKMRFFKWYADKPENEVEIRALGFDPEVKRRDDPEVHAKNVFCRQIPADMTHSDLFAELSRCASASDIKSVKVAYDPEKHKSRKYGFVSFTTKEAAQAVLERSESENHVLFHKYNPKSKSEMRKVFNNIIVKGFQQDETKVDDAAYLEDRKAYLTKLFEKFGKLQSVFVQKVNSTKADVPSRLLAFVCFENPDTAAKAVEELHEKEIDGQKLYVAEALKKQQLAKEIFKFKNAKKRCNLFVKGFPADITEDKLKEFFEGITGPDSIEKMRLEKDKQDPTKAKYAFVCFKSPELANTVKNQIATNPQQMLGGSRLFINNYEPKEMRMIQQQEARDRADYSNATSQVSGNMSQVDQLFQKPELVQTLMFIMQHLQSQGRPMNRGRPMGQGAPRGNFQGQPPMNRQNFPQARPQPQMQPPRPMPGAMPMGQMPHQGMPQAMHPGAMPQMPPQQNPMAIQYMQTVQPIIPGVVETNEHAKDFVGEKIYEFVLQLAGEQHAPKITGMLIDLPLEEIRDYLMDFSKFERKVQQAKTLLNNQQ